MMLKYATVNMQKANFDLRVRVINCIIVSSSADKSGTQRRQSRAMNVTIGLLCYLPTVWMELFHNYCCLTNSLNPKTKYTLEASKQQLIISFRHHLVVFIHKI